MKGPLSWRNRTARLVEDIVFYYTVYVQNVQDTLFKLDLLTSSEILNPDSLVTTLLKLYLCASTNKKLHSVVVVTYRYPRIQTLCMRCGEISKWRGKLKELRGRRPR